MMKRTSGISYSKSRYLVAVYKDGMAQFVGPFKTLKKAQLWGESYDGIIFDLFVPSWRRGKFGDTLTNR